MNTDRINFSNKNPFTVPENYFSELESNIYLQTLKKDNFKAPENYFSKLEESILEQTIVKKEGKGKIISLFSAKKYYWVAACIIFAVSIGLFTLRNQEQRTFVSVDKSNTEKFFNNNYQQQTNNSEITNQSTAKRYVNYTPKSKPKIKQVSHSPNQQDLQFSEKSSQVIYDLYFNDDEVPTEDNDHELFF